jgi:uncharacterized phage protein gp47/JayE
MALSQADIARQMLAQLKVLDPSVSAEIGTPERKILDTVAQALAENQIDLDVLSGALDLDTRFGQNLDRFLALFGFERMRATKARGFVTFSRETPALTNLRIPLGTQVVAHSTSGIEVGDNFYVTTLEGVLPQGETSVILPVEAVSAGSLSNVDRQAISDFSGTVAFGVTSVTNELPITGGTNQEPDDEFKIRFKNTVFRNLAGTESQYLALAASSAYTTKANVVGPVSRYREYVEVPKVDDASSYDINDGGTSEPGAGNSGEFTTAISTIPYSKHIYETIPHFVSNGKAGIDLLFYRNEVDYILNITGKSKGDAYRLYNPQEATFTDPENLAKWRESVPDPNNSPYQPNITFINVYQGPDPTIEAIHPEDVLLFEHSYMSSSSRNDWDRNITNCVDVFIDGGNSVFSSTTVPVPQDNPNNIFIKDATNRYYSLNFRRKDSPNHPPIEGNYFIPLYWQPVTDIPASIVIEGTAGGGDISATYFLGQHYWLVEDISGHYGTIRARNGFEWSMITPGVAPGDTEDNPSTWTGPTLGEWDEFDSVSRLSNTIEVTDYAYDKNIVDVQTAIEGARQATTDVLVHKARRRYFKLDVTVMYAQGVSIGETNLAIQSAINAFFARQYYGTAIQLSDLLQTIHNVFGVDNVRWSSDIPTGGDFDRLIETDRLGNPLLGPLIDVVNEGSVGSPPVYRFIIGGDPQGGTITLKYSAFTQTLDFTDYLSDRVAWRTNLEAAIEALTGRAVDDILGNGTPENPYYVTFSTNGPLAFDFIVQNVALTGGPTVYETDFFLADDELPGLPEAAVSTDTLPGLIIRKRAQNTWVKAKPQVG